MKILYADFGSICSRDIIEAFHYMGYNVDQIMIDNNMMDAIIDTMYYAVDDKVKKDSYDCVFSFNYIPTLSEVCKDNSIKYVSWVYDSPCQSLYFCNVLNECNYIFGFDSYTVNDLKKRGVKNIFYMPLGVNSNRLTKMQIKPKEYQLYTSEISFIGSLYLKECGLYEYLKTVADDKLMGYIDGIIELQTRVFSQNFVDELLTDDIVNQLQSCSPCSVSEYSLITPRYLYSNYYIYRKMANKDRTETLSNLSKKYKVNVYTNVLSKDLGNCKNRGPADYYKVAPKVFRCSKINLNTTLRSIRSGMPLRVLDIMAAGGFAISNYQEDILRHFEPDKEIVLYQCYEELQEKVEFYMTHDSERHKLREIAHKKVLKDFEYSRLLKEIFRIAELTK